MSNILTTSVNTEGNKKSIWVHSFLNAPKQMVTKETKDKGIREFKTFCKTTKILVGDLIVKWDDSNQIKTVHRVIGSTGSESISNCSQLVGTGVMEDIILLDKLTPDIAICINRVEVMTHA